MKRREILKTTSALVGAVGSIGVARGAYAGGTDLIKVALVGCGGRGRGALQQRMTAGDNVKIYALADAFESAAKATEKAFNDQGDERFDVKDRVFWGLDAYKKAIDCLRPGDLVLLVAPGAFRSLHFEYAVQKGVHVFLEKPFGVDTPTLKRALAAWKVAQQKNLKVIDASKGMELLKDGDEENPHVWLSVTADIQQVRNITEQLKAADPKHADAYQANADAYIAKLEALKKEMHEALDNVPHKDIVTFHEAFPYFAKEFGLHILTVIEREPGSEPTPAELQAVIEQVKPLTAKVLFTEPQYSPDAAKTIARETGARIYTLDPVVTGEAKESAMDAYLTTMRKNMETLKEALQ